MCGYYDQSHFIHDFIRVCGCTPKAYVEKMTSYYQEPYKF
ncbi:MAG: AraC family transcriptional regulator [Longicatena caecimuris]